MFFVFLTVFLMQALKKGDEMSTIRYLCSGSCGQMITLEAYKRGQKKCTDKSCDNFGSSLERGEYCSQCNTNFDEGEDHFCI